jgi:hypothetical protein
MPRPFEDHTFEALEHILADSETDPSRVTALLHELSFRRDPACQTLKERAEQARLALIIAQAQFARPMHSSGPMKAESASRHSSSEDFPGFNATPILAEMDAAPTAPKPSAEDRWRAPQPHLAMLALSAVGIAALTAAVLTGAFKPSDDAKRVTETPSRPIEVAALPYLPSGDASDAIIGNAAGLAPAVNGVSPASAAIPGTLPELKQLDKPAIRKLNLTTEIANMYSGEGPAIARAAVAAAGLGLNETVRWRNEKTGRHGAVTLVGHDRHRTNCYTARISRLDTKVAQYRTRELCF